MLHVGCGLGTRVYRRDSAAGVHWYHIDHPEVIESCQ
ncbi:class I SAM-dependent methyltransferase [Mycobacterium uberis]